MKAYFNVYAIAKNEEKNYEEFFEHLTDTDNIYIGDTGSDSTEDIEAFCVDQGIYWENLVDKVATDESYFDFSDHRNYLLGYAESQRDCIKSLDAEEEKNFFISLDLDERLEEGWREKLETKLAHNPEANALQFDIHINDGNPYSFKAVRGSLSGTHEWEYPIHEILRPIGDMDNQNLLDTGIKIYHKPDDSKTRDYLPACFALVDKHPNEPRSYHYLGRELMFRNKFTEALGVFSRYINLGENGNYLWPAETAIIYNYIAFCNEHLSNVFGAEIAYYKAVCEKPKCREVWMDLSDFYFRQDKFVEAYTFIKRALELPFTDEYMYHKPIAYNDVHTHHQACFVAYQAGLIENSKQHITRAIQLTNGKPNEALVKDYVSLYGKAPNF